jgi:hypothetical protein
MTPPARAAWRRSYRPRAQAQLATESRMRGGRSAPGVGAPGGSYARPLTRVAPAPPAAVCARACALSLCLLVSGQTVHRRQ